MITISLIETIVKQYPQEPMGRHGISHWARVLEIGRIIGEKNGANMKVVELFSVFHDSRRFTEGFDKGHGKRGAELAYKLRGEYFQLPDNDFQLLYYACEEHTSGLTDADITVQTCWDSDRLDLGRASITPNPKFLCSNAAKDPAIIEWAHKRSCALESPELISEEWKLSPEIIRAN